MWQGLDPVKLAYLTTHASQMAASNYQPVPYLSQYAPGLLLHRTRHFLPRGGWNHQQHMLNPPMRDGQAEWPEAVKPMCCCLVTSICPLWVPDWPGFSMPFKSTYKSLSTQQRENSLTLKHPVREVILALVRCRDSPVLNWNKFHIHTMRKNKFATTSKWQNK